MSTDDQLFAKCEQSSGLRGWIVSHETDKHYDIGPSRPAPSASSHGGWRIVLHHRRRDSRACHVASRVAVVTTHRSVRPCRERPLACCGGAGKKGEGGEKGCGRGAP